MRSEEFSTNEDKGFKRRSFQICRQKTKGSFSGSIRQLLFVILSPGLLDSHLHGTLADPAIGNTRENGNLIIECSVLFQDLENVKVFYFLHNADVFLIEAVDKRKTNSYEELLLTTLIVQLFCFLFSWSERMGEPL